MRKCGDGRNGVGVDHGDDERVRTGSNFAESCKMQK